MKCQRCGGQSQVLETTPRSSGVNRRRRCRGCGHRWNTVEMSEDDTGVVERLIETDARSIGELPAILRSAANACQRALDELSGQGGRQPMRAVAR